MQRPKNNLRCLACTLPVFAFGLIAAVGCSTQNPRYRTHVSPDRDPTLLERVERPVEHLQQALDNLDRDLENAVY